MRAAAHVQTVYAGLGVTGSLVAAIGAMFLVASGVLAFDRWPDGGGPLPEQALEVAAAAERAAAAPAVVALPAAVRISAGRAGASRAADGAAAATPGRAARPAAQPAPRDPASAPPASPVVAGATDVAAPSGESSLADAVASSTGATADAVRSFGTEVPLTAPVVDLVARAVDGAGAAMSGLLAGS